MFIAANIGYMWGLALGIVSILLLWSQRGPNVDHGWVLWVAVALVMVVAGNTARMGMPGLWARSRRLGGRTRTRK